MISPRLGSPVAPTVPAVLRGLLLVLAAASIAAGPVAPDLMLVNARVHLEDGTAQALAIQGGRIVAIGSTDAVRRMAGPKTRVLDVAGGSVLPGLTDSHVHVQFAGLEQAQCGFPSGADAAAVAARVQQCAAKARPGAWVRGGNWVAAAFAPGEQTRTLLDRAAPSNPVLLTDEAHHSVWVNSRALALAGVTRATPDPHGGIIDRDAAGEPTGVLREAATELVERVVPPPTDAEKAAAVARSTRQMLAHGITAFTDASVRRDNVATLSRLSGDGTILQTVRGCIVWAPTGDANTMGEVLIAERARYERPRFRLDCVKIFLDGVPTESRTAAMLAPYEGAPPGPSARGMLLIAPGVLARAVTRFDRMGLGVKFHAAGDGAVRAAVDAVAAAQRANGPKGPIHAIGHASFVDAADIARARTLRMAWEFSPYIWYPTPIASVDIRRAVGDRRMERWIPVRDAIESGALVVAGSDWSVVPSVNPWLGMETMVTREMPSGSADTLGAGQRVSLEQAFRTFASNGARLMRRSDAGTIAVGQRADLVVTRDDPLAMPIYTLHRIDVRMVLVDGQVVHRAVDAE